MEKLKLFEDFESHLDEESAKTRFSQIWKETKKDRIYFVVLDSALDTLASKDPAHRTAGDFEAAGISPSLVDKWNQDMIYSVACQERKDFSNTAQQSGADIGKWDTVERGLTIDDAIAHAKDDAQSEHAPGVYVTNPELEFELNTATEDDDAKEDPAKELPSLDDIGKVDDVNGPAQQMNEE
jgi:hypothetical protein